MKVIRIEKFTPRKRNTTAPKKPPVRLRRSDWGVLMQHNRITGKLDMKSKEVIRDPSSVKRLLEAEMIYPDGRLTPEARKKCAALTEKLQNDGAPGSVDPEPICGKKPVAVPVKKADRASVAHWAWLMKYDRKTGNLLRIEPETGRLDKASRLILKDPAIIQRLLDEKLILPGGWLTPEAKQRCVRIEKNIRARAQNRYSGQGVHHGRKSKIETEPKVHSGRKPETERNVQDFFESLPHDVMVAATEAGIHAGYDDWQDEKGLQAFFENLPDAPPEPDPWTYLAYDWQNERDLQAYYEKLPQDFQVPGIDEQPGRESAPHKGRSGGNSRRDAGSKK